MTTLATASSVAADPGQAPTLPSVLHVLWSMRIGGAERAVYQLVREQRRSGRRADVLVANEAGRYGKLAREAGATVYELHARSALSARVPFRALRIFTAYDVVHFHGVEPTLMAASVLARRQVRVYTHRAGEHDYTGRQRVRYATGGFLVRRYFDGVSGNTACAARYAATIFRLGTPEPRVTYNGLEFDLLAPSTPAATIRRQLALPENAFVVGTVANLRRWKRTDRVLEAVSQLGDDAFALIVGDGPDVARLETLAEQLEIADRVVFVGVAPNVADYLQIMDAFCLASTAAESFGNAAVEAMALGVPTTVFADGGGLTEHVDDGRTGFVVSSTTALCDTLELLRRDADLRTAIGRSGREAVRTKYTLAASAAAYSELYESSLRHRSSARD